MAGILKDPRIRARIDEQGADIVASSPDACATFIRGESAKWGAVIRDNNIHADA